MSDLDQPPTPDCLLERLRRGAREATACLDRLDAADAETRKRALQAVQAVAEESPRSFSALTRPLSVFLTDDDRAVRLTAAKLFVTLAQSEPAAVVSVADELADRLADEGEFYYVRARSAEALGYVAADSPDAVTDPETLADLHIGLAFDEPEVREKLAKALAYVAVGTPERLRHHVDSLADQLDDDNELVRYHLCTALVVVGCASPETLLDVAKPLRRRFGDENPYVRGRAAEALGLLAASDVGIEIERELESVATEDDAPSFLTDRVAFCRRQLATETSVEPPDGVGTIESVRTGTDDVVEEMNASADGVCSHCGLVLSETGPPMCPQCGAPR